MFPSLFISHGSPMLALQPGASGPALQRLAAEMPRPKAIVVVSAHWESHELLVSGSAAPETWHDFGGFPRELFAVQYPAPGDPQLAGEIVELLHADGLNARIDDQRPFDHGTWVPLSLMYPAADIPVVQVSLPSRMGPALQTRVGQALASLRNRGVLLIGSGSITHNLHDWRSYQDGKEAPYVRPFIEWVEQRLQADDSAALLDYRRQAPHAAQAHPSDEHLQPLHVAMGAAGGDALGAQRIDAGIDAGFLAMDIYRFDGADAQQRAA